MIKQNVQSKHLDPSSFSIIIPAFNEGQVITETLQKIFASSYLKDTEVIVVDDGSIDDTASQVEHFDRINLVRHQVNKGYGAALITGMKTATRDFVVWMDSDGQHRVEDVIAVIEAIIRDNLDYCIGVRGASSYQEPSRRLGKYILRKVVCIAAGRQVADFNSGLRGFRRSIIRKYLHLLPKGFGASTTTTLIMMERSYKGKEMPITVLKRVGKSSVRQFHDGMRTLTLILRIFLIFKPLHFFGGIGGIMALFGLGYGLWVAVAEGIGFPVLGAVVFLTGLQIMFTGLVMDQISAMRRERFE